VAKLSDLAEHSQGIQPWAEGLFRGKRRVPRAQLPYERRFPRVSRLRRVQTSAVFGEENEKGPGRGFQKRLEGIVYSCTYSTRCGHSAALAPGGGMVGGGCAIFGLQLFFDDYLNNVKQTRLTVGCRVRDDKNRRTTICDIRHRFTDARLLKFIHMLTCARHCSTVRSMIFL